MHELRLQQVYQKSLVCSSYLHHQHSTHSTAGENFFEDGSHMFCLLLDPIRNLFPKSNCISGSLPHLHALPWRVSVVCQRAYRIDFCHVCRVIRTHNVSHGKRCRCMSTDCTPQVVSGFLNALSTHDRIAECTDRVI